jgi:tRNA (cytidine56-2'-O)-methyltransferase
VALTARAWGARTLYLEPPDPRLAEGLSQVGDRFGGSFQVQGLTNPRSFLRQYPGTILHLTVYGEDLDRVKDQWTGPGPFLLVVGGAKVPPEIYALAHHNVAVTHQPHSEVAALALVLDRLLGTPTEEERPGARLRILASARGKRVEERLAQGTGPSVPGAAD